MNSRKVLVIDDSLVIRQTVGDVLRSAGFEVLEAADGEQGFRAISQAERGTPFTLIVSDVKMPFLDGFGMIERVRAQKLATKTPIVMLTAEADPALVARAKTLGVRAWMVKPLKAETLLRLAKRMLLESPSYG